MPITVTSGASLGIRRFSPWSLPLLLLIVLLTVPNVLFAQGQEYHYGDEFTTTMSVEATTSVSSGGLLITPTFSIFRNNHKVDVGIPIPIYDVWGHGQGFTGLFASYKFFPDRRRKKANLYFTYQMMFLVRDKSTVTAEIPRMIGSPLLTMHNYRHEHMLGMGFDRRVGKIAYIFLDWNVGVSLNWVTFENYPAIFEVQSSAMGRLGVGFNIGKRR